MATYRRGTTVTETLVAIVLLSTAAIGVSKMFGQTRDSLRTMEFASLCSWELENAKAIIHSWPTDQVTAAKIEAMPISPAIIKQAADARWQTTVVTIQEPIQAIQVTIAINAARFEQPAANIAKLTFWLPAERSSVQTMAEENVAEENVTEDDSQADATEANDP